jgi:hypothetical protein
MKIAAVTVTNQPDHPGLKQLKRSAEKHGYDFTIFRATWRGYGGKVLDVAEFCRENQQQDYTHILFMDAHDSYFLRPYEDFVAKIWNPELMIIGAKKACWPDPDRAQAYEYISGPFSPWRYVNSGQYLAPIDLFLRIVDENPIHEREDDQRWMTSIYLSAKYKTHLDTGCMFFQSIAFEAERDFEINKVGLCNKITDSRPCAAHGNGRTPMGWIYRL